VLRPFTQSREHGLRDADELLDKIRRNPVYRSDFAAAFYTSSIALPQVGVALAAYLRSLSSGSSAYDRFVVGDAGALTESARRGLELFRGAAGCAECHRLAGSRAAFTDESFHRVGVGLSAIASRLPELTARVAVSSADQIDRWVFEDRDIAALGRFLVTRDPRDIGAYRTPSLRNVAVTAPYMHDGSVATLREAVNLEAYYRVQQRGRPLALSLADQADLVEFLMALTDAPYVRAANARPSTTGAGSDGMKR
jgi:cytochrome c peroxidase